jgi:hypothetical protein
MVELYGFDLLIEDFLKKEITASTFEKKFLSLFKNDDLSLNKDVYSELDNLFYYVDCYTDIPLSPGDKSENYINEIQLRNSAEKALKALRSLK